jgi:hypothetical protein
MSRSIAGATSKTLPAPVEGWDTREALADMSEKRAVVLDNWFPTTDKINIRPGYALFAAAFYTVDFGLVSDVATETEDWGSIADSSTESYDMGSIA